MEFDIAIVGAGPGGLAAACALAGAGRSVAVIERHPARVLEAPEPDGREIALTHQSVAILEGFGAWGRIPAGEVSPLMEARVLNGSDGLALRFAPPPRQGLPLARLVPNHLIRRALFEAAMEKPGVTLRDGAELATMQAGPDRARLVLGGGEAVEARLVVAADTRFSPLRRAQGIGAAMHDFGKTMLVCRMAHDAPHGGVATEWFAHGITIATLPLNGEVSSVVVTLPHFEAERLRTLEAADFEAEIGAHLARRPGADRMEGLRLLGPRHAWPLVAVYAHRFAGRRLALAGDAAVGMHPVTAHGFNFGLAGAARLAEAVAGAADPGDAGRLRRYERRHRAGTFPLFAATNAIAGLYTDDRPPARLARSALIGMAAAAAPLRRLIAARLVQARPSAA